MPTISPEPPAPRPWTAWQRLAWGIPLVGSGLLGLGLAVVYLVRPDPCAALTIFPVWAWLVPGLTLLAFNLRGRGKRWGWSVLMAWLVGIVALAEEPGSLGRALVWAGSGLGEPRPGEVVRVVTLNCAIGNRLAAEEVVSFHPDIVLLQESPGRAEVEELGRRLFGAEAGVVVGVDASLVARGRVVAADLPTTLRGYFVEARVTLPSGRQVEVVSTRLVPAVFRADLWAPDCWREQAANRRTRREQLRAIARRVAASPVPVIVGGDFNAPQGDDALRVLEPRLRDTFTGAGIGWGNTILNEFPVLRIDQVWASAGFQPVAVRALPTRNSDHRLVVCDLRLAPGREGK